MHHQGAAFNYKEKLLFCLNSAALRKINSKSCALYFSFYSAGISVSFCYCSALRGTSATKNTMENNATFIDRSYCDSGI